MLLLRPLFFYIFMAKILIYFGLKYATDIFWNTKGLIQWSLILYLGVHYTGQHKSFTYTVCLFLVCTSPAGWHSLISLQILIVVVFVNSSVYHFSRSQSRLHLQPLSNLLIILTYFTQSMILFSLITTEMVISNKVW